MKENKSPIIKSDWDIRECFRHLRFHEKFHLGLGDIRLTIAMQDEICDLVEKFYGNKNNTNNNNEQTN